jgi:hypothetical protein
MSILVENKEIHLIGNVNGCIDEYVVIPFLIAFNIIEESKPQEIMLHLSGRGVMCGIQPLIDVIRYSKIPVDVYIRNSEFYGGYNGIGQELIDFYTVARKVYDYRQREYNPPFYAALPEIQMMREYDMYKFGNYEEDLDDVDEEEISP